MEREFNIYNGVYHQNNGNSYIVWMDCPDADNQLVCEFSNKKHIETVLDKNVMLIDFNDLFALQDKFTNHKKYKAGRRRSGMTYDFVFEGLTRKEFLAEEGKL